MEAANGTQRFEISDRSGLCVAYEMSVESSASGEYNNNFDAALIPLVADAYAKAKRTHEEEYARFRDFNGESFYVSQEALSEEDE